MFRATILKVKIGTIPVKDFKMVQETKAAIQAELRKLTPIATPLSNTIIPKYALEIIHLLQSISTWAFTKNHRLTFGLNSNSLQTPMH